MALDARRTGHVSWRDPEGGDQRGARPSRGQAGSHLVRETATNPASQSRARQREQLQPLH